MMYCRYLSGKFDFQNKRSKLLKALILHKHNCPYYSLTTCLHSMLEMEKKINFVPDYFRNMKQS